MSDYNKPKHTVPKFEECEIGKPYACTINPTDNLQQYYENSVRRFHTFNDAIQLKIKKVLHPYCKSYYFSIEISPLGRLHLHGTIVLSDKIGFYLQIHKLFDIGTVCIKEEKDQDVWFQYCIKQHNSWGNIEPEIYKITNNKMTDEEILRSQLDD